MSSKRNIILDKNGVSPVLESLVAIGISISLLIVFFVAANSIYSTHDRPNVDLEAKSIDIMESLLNSPGQGVGYDPSWETDVDNMSIIGLATHPTIEYGILDTSDEGEITVIYRERVSDSRIGIAKTCFLAGTKVVMADESYKSIEDIVVGDMVKSFDEENGRLVDRGVTCVFHHAPEEMTDYYLAINNWLRVTPNHRIFSNGRWIITGDLNIGDFLFYPSSDCRVFSIERVYERVPTYDFEVGVDHCYFVAMDTSDVLVHNAQPLIVDANGPYDGRVDVSVQFDGEVISGNGGYSYEWDFDDSDGIQVESTEEDPTHVYTQAGIYTATFTVTDSIPLTNSDTATVTINYPPVADFTWFDSDSLAPGTDISFDASSSSYGGDVATFEWWWDWNLDWNEESPPPPNATGANPSYDFEDNGTYLVMLRVNDSAINDTCIHAVQANTLNLPDADWRPWVATSKEIYPSSDDDTLASFDKNYYVEYENLPDGNFSFEVKLKTSTNYIILDYGKVDNLKNVSYSNVTSGLNLDTSTSIFYSVNITISNDEGIISTLGPSYDNANVIESIYREVLIYHKPTISSIDNIIPPYYESGTITVHVFIGGLAPIDLPVEPDSTEATFGYETGGGSGLWIGKFTIDPFSGSEGMGSYCRGTTYSPLSSGTLTEMHAYILVYPYGYSYRLTLAIFEEDFYGADSHKLIEAHTTGWITTTGWVTITGFSQSITAGTNYILAASAQPPSNPPESVTVKLRYDDIGTNRYYEQSGFGGKGGFPADPWDLEEAGTGRKYSIYATYNTI